MRTFKDLSKEEKKHLLNDIKKDVEKYNKENNDTLTFIEALQFLGIDKEGD